MVYNMYKELGLTPLQALSGLREHLPELAGQALTYAGRLDPMAEGVLLILAGEDAKNREPYLSLEKTYETEALFGVSTDSFDLLGIPELSKSKKITPNEISKALTQFVGTANLAVPSYSSVPVKGKPLFEWARSGRISEVEIPVRAMDIQQIKLLGTKTISSENLLKEVFNRIQKVTGNFRQKEILEKWGMILGNKPVEFSVAKILVSCSSGTYVRSIIHELGKKLGTSATVFSLKRLTVGRYAIIDSLKV